MSSPTLPLDRATRELYEDRELAPWALRSAQSSGRHHAEPEDELRTAWERDRDRIVHCTAFRRLMYKTQAFVNHQGDHLRTRLSHSLEVSQVARSVAQALGLNETFCEALALAHDIGHPPFGHRGEAALDGAMGEHGGFRHNAQVLRVVDLLERRSPDYSGINLTRELRESLLKHEKRADWPAEFGQPPSQPWLEAQVVDLADSTAYHLHDLEDGLFADMFTEEDVHAGVDLWREARALVEERHPGFLERTTDTNLRNKRIINQLFGLTINDLIETTHARLATGQIATPSAARAERRPTLGHGKTMTPRVMELQAFLWARFYRHEYLQQFSVHAERILSALFSKYVADPKEMAPWYRSWAQEVGVPRAVCDYLAGMTDRFAELEYKRLVG